MYPQAVVSSLYSGKECINIQVNFIIVGIGGDISEQVQLENRGLVRWNIQKWQKISMLWEEILVLKGLSLWGGH